jgi:hypothetical protein
VRRRRGHFGGLTFYNNPDVNKLARALGETDPAKRTQII